MSDIFPVGDLSLCLLGPFDKDLLLGPFGKDLVHSFGKDLVDSRSLSKSLTSTSSPASSPASSLASLVPIVLSKEVEVEHEEALPPLTRAVRVEYESAWLMARVAGVVNVTLLYTCSTVSSTALAMLLCYSKLVIFMYE